MVRLLSGDENGFHKFVCRFDQVTRTDSPSS
jgi:hypothetical protein